MVDSGVSLTSYPMAMARNDAHTGDISMDRDDSAYFKMGAAVAVSELFGLGRLGSPAKVAGETREFLGSFGIRSMEDVDALGICGPYVEDLARIYGCSN